MKEGYKNNALVEHLNVSIHDICSILSGDRLVSNLPYGRAHAAKLFLFERRKD